MGINVRMHDTRAVDVHWDVGREEWIVTVRGLDPLSLIEPLISRNSSVRLARHFRYAADLLDAALAAEAQAQRNGSHWQGIPTDAMPDPPAPPNRR